MLKPNQSCPVLLTIGVDRETSGLLFAHQRSGGVDVISHLCKRCLKAVQRLQDMKRWTKCCLGRTNNSEREQQLFGCIACLYDLEHTTFLMSELSRQPLQCEQADVFPLRLWPRQRAEYDGGCLVDVAGEDSNCCRLTQLAIIATGPHSPLRYSSVSTNFSSPLPDMHTYSRRPDKEPKRPALMKLPVDVTCHRECKRQEEQPYPIPGEIRENTDTHQWPAVVWQCFMKGTTVSFGGRGQVAWHLVDDLAQQERLGPKTSLISSYQRYAPNGLKLSHVGEQKCGGTFAEDTIGTFVLTFSPEVRGQPQLRARCIKGHPFFVKDKGWCSLQPDVTARHYGMWCSELELEDWCLPPSHPDAIVTHHALDTFKSYDLTPMDSTAVITLCNMARKRSLSQSDAVTTVDQGKKADNALAHRAKRPMNAFMLFAKKCRMEFTRMYPGRDNREISVLLGNTWQKMKMEERKMYAVEARLLAEQYKKLNPDCWKRKRAASWCLERLVKEYEANIQDDHTRIKEAKAVSQALTEKTSEMQAVKPYRTIQRGEPPTRPVPATFSSSTEPQHKFMPLLARMSFRDSASGHFGFGPLAENASIFLEGPGD
ncbi:hypothetical protein NP493_1g12053 [Ridgeia piscesae]|uniref:HMG box-containing protein 1 n=1 Tax=Ridgeia piscesae TaxID=27915 RepID=A0AAD9PGT8_RIDPI|nr:hypothetical protein NP493_1g12053 [Ridgeia piscesae]